MINKCNKCGVELSDSNWSSSWKLLGLLRCKGCSKETNDRNNPRHNPRNNPNRMFVNGTYISNSHPLYKAGRYKSFDHAAFDSLSNYKKTKEGEVYAIENKAWAGWIKIGMAIDAEDRLNGYQTSSPHRDYVLLHKVFFKDRRKAESTVHKLATKVAKKRMNEWFLMSPLDAIKIINSLDTPPVSAVEQMYI